MSTADRPKISGTRMRLLRRISQLEDSLARPVEEGTRWEDLRKKLERELERAKEAYATMR